MWHMREIVEIEVNFFLEVGSVSIAIQRLLHGRQWLEMGRNRLEEICQLARIAVFRHGFGYRLDTSPLFFIVCLAAGGVAFALRSVAEFVSTFGTWARTRIPPWLQLSLEYATSVLHRMSGVRRRSIRSKFHRRVRIHFPALSPHPIN